MFRVTISAAFLGLCIACVCASASAQDESTDGVSPKAHAAQQAEYTDADIDRLYDLVRQARADLESLRVKAGITGESGEGHREGRGEHAGRHREGPGEHGAGQRKGRGEHDAGRREGRGEHGNGHREGRGEHGGGETATGEEGGRRLGKSETWNETRNGAHLVLAYDAATRSFNGVVQNRTSKTLSDVRVEVHLSNGVELGPTERTDLKPGAKISVELSAANQAFTWWTTHPEHGSEEGHGPGHESERGGMEHGEGDGSRPNDPALRPLYNQLQLLRQEIKLLAKSIEDGKP